MDGSFVWDVRIKGATPQDIKNRKEDLKRSGPPRPGSVNLRNDQEERSALNPSLSPAASIREILGGTLRLIGLASGLPGHEVGAEQDANRSTAQESRSISTNRAKSFQREICLMASEWIRYMLDQKRYLGVLPEVPAEERRVEWVAAELDARDEGATADSVRKLAEGLIPLLNAGLILAKDARTVIYNALEIDAPSDEEMAADAHRTPVSSSGNDEEENPRSTENIENILSRFERGEGSIEEILSDDFASTEIWEEEKSATPAGRPRTDVLRWRTINGRPIPITEPKGGRGSHEEPTPSGHPASPSTKLSLAALGRQRREIEKRAAREMPHTPVKTPDKKASKKRSWPAFQRARLWTDASGTVSLPFPIPKGVDLRYNTRIAEQHLFDVLWFYEMVHKTGPWDFKRPYDKRGQAINKKFGNFGDYHYGYVGAAAGIPLIYLLNCAGWAQQGDHKGVINAGQGVTANLLFPWWGGKSPYGDDPYAQELIERGFQQYCIDVIKRLKNGEIIT